MFAFLAFAASADKSDYFFWNARDDGIFFNGKNMFSDHWWVRPGLKIEKLKTEGGPVDFIHYETEVLNETLMLLWAYGGNENYDKLANRLNFVNSFSTQINTFSSHEVYDGNNYAGREFAQYTTFISYKKKGNIYSFSAMPFTTKVRAETFLWSRAHWTYISEEEEFDLSRANDKRYVDYVYNYVNSMKKITKAPYKVLITSDTINAIYRKLNAETPAQKSAFLNMLKKV